MATSLQWPLSSVPKVAFVERFNYLLGKDSLPHNLFILVTQQSAHCVTRQKQLWGRLRNTVIWLDISEILFTSGLVWTGTWLYTKGGFHSAKISLEISEIPCAKWITYIPVLLPNPSHCTFGFCTCQQDTEEQYWGKQFCQIERDILVWPAKITRLVKADHLQSWSQIFWSEWAE